MRLHRPIENTATYTDFAPSACTIRQMTDEERKKYGEVNKNYKRKTYLQFMTKEQTMNEKRGPGRPRKDDESKLIEKVRADHAASKKRQLEIQSDIDELIKDLQEQKAVSEYLSGLLELVK